MPVQVKAHGSGAYVDLGEDDGGVHLTVQAEHDGQVLDIEVPLSIVVGLARYATRADPVAWHREMAAQAAAELADDTAG